MRNAHPEAQNNTSKNWFIFSWQIEKYANSCSNISASWAKSEKKNSNFSLSSEQNGKACETLFRTSLNSKTVKHIHPYSRAVPSDVNATSWVADFTTNAIIQWQSSVWFLTERLTPAQYKNTEQLNFTAACRALLAVAWVWTVCLFSAVCFMGPVGRWAPRPLLNRQRRAQHHLTALYLYTLLALN